MESTRYRYAFDLDGCLVDFTRDIYQPAGELVLGRGLKQHHEDTYSLRDQFQLSSREDASIWESRELLDLMTTTPVISLLAFLSIRGRTDFCFITSRSCDGEINAERIKEITRQWVLLQLLSNQPVYFAHSTEKHLLAEELGVELMMEDNPTTIERLIGSGVKVRMPVYRYNDHIVHPLVERVEGWRTESTSLLRVRRDNRAVVNNSGRAPIITNHSIPVVVNR